MHPLAPLRVTTGQESRAGLKEINEDSMGLLVPAEPELLESKGVCVVIADGVSAAEAGREAAETCVQTFLGDYYSTPDTWTVQTSAQKVLTALNRWLYSRSTGFVSTEKGYVCTLSILVIKSCTAYFFHVGDTRVWLKRKGELKQLTKDHSVTVSQGNTLLARAMGMDSNVSVDFHRESVEAGDVFLLTTDGVHSYIDRDQLSELMEGDDPDAACNLILDAALAADSPDNVTCQIVRVDKVPDSTADEYMRRLTALPFPPPLSKGVLLDGLRIERELHSSPRSEVYLVQAVDSGKRYALKTPSVNYEDDPAYIERFALEQWLGLRAKSKHLLRSIRLPSGRTCLYNLMEYIEGQTLASWIAAKSAKVVRPPEEVVPLIEQVVAGLYALHRQEIVHQDLKPDNILLNKEGVIKLIDYGSCFVSGIDEITAPIARDRALGTRSYSAPEYSLGGAITPRVDLYSLAVLTYEMLTGKLPYGEGAIDARTPKDFAKLEYLSAITYNPRVPVWMDGAIRKAVSVNAADRYEELSEFLYDLDHPNTEFLKGLKHRKEQKGPQWRSLALVLIATQLVSLVYILTQLRGAGR